MKKYLLHVLIISFVFLLAPTAQVATYAGEVEGVVEHEDLKGIKTRHVLFCNIGRYESPAIMVLNWDGPNESGTSEIEGYYFYVRHQKNIDLKGFSDSRTRGIYLNESYKGEPTGYMEFYQGGIDGASYWTSSKENDDHQDFNSEELFFRDPSEKNLVIQKDKYRYKHTDDEDELNYVIINDEYFAFDIRVTRGMHWGKINGITKISDVNQVLYVDDEQEGCKLTFDLSEEGSITVVEKACWRYRGARASFDGIYSKQGTVQVASYAGDIKSYRDAVRYNPDAAGAHYNLGLAYSRAGMDKEAIKSYKQAIRINPDYAEAHYDLGVDYFESGKYKEAIESYEQAIRIKPDDAYAHTNLGNTYRILGMEKKAIKSYEQAIGIDPDHALAHNNLGNAYSKLGMEKEAIESYKQAISINPDYAAAHYNLGVAYISLNDRDSALEQYEILKNLDTEMEVLHEPSVSTIHMANDLFNFINE